MPKLPAPKPRKTHDNKWLVEVAPSISETGSRQQRKFKTRDEATEFAKTIKATNKEFGQRRNLSPHDSTDALAALAILRPLSANLVDAARFYKKHHDLRAKAPTVGRAIAEGIDQRGHRSTVYLSNLRQFERRVPDTFKDQNMADVTSQAIKVMLDQTMAGQTARRDGKRLLSLFFEDQVKAGNLEKNPCLAVIYPKIKDLEEPAIYSVDQLKALFQACKTFPDGIDRDCRGCAIAFAFLAFAGIRPAELERMTWDDVVLPNENIRLVKKIAKTRQTRNIPINPTLMAWIKSVPENKRKGKIVPSRWRMKAGRVKKQAGLDGKALQDALRHSYGSYWLAMNPDDMGILNLAMGHQHVSTYLNYYHKALTQKEAAPYCDPAPELRTLFDEGFAG